MFIAYIVIFITFFWVNIVYAISFSANWRGLRAKETPTTVSKAYSFSFSHRLSRTMSFTGSLRYLRSDQEDKYREMLVPSLFYTLANDLFNYNLGFSASQAESKDRATLKNYSITNTFSTNIKKTRVNIFYNFAKNWNEANPKTLDTKNESWGLNLSRNFYRKYLKNLFLSYLYRFNKNNDYITKSKTESSTHSFNGRYFKKIGKLNFRIEQRYSISTMESWYNLVGGKAKVEIGLTTNGTLPSTIYDTNETVIIIPYSQSIEGIEFYIDYTNKEKIPSTVIFDIYYSNNGITWNTLATNVSLPYTFPSPISYRWLKLVVKSGAGNLVSGGIELPDPRIIGFYYVKERHTERKMVYYITTGSLSYIFPKGIRANYFGYYQVQKPDYGNKRTIQNHSFYTSWQGKPYFRPSFRFNISKTKEENKPEIKNRTISISIASTPIKTINLGAGYSNNNYYEEDRKVFSTDTYGLSSVFTIFPDLTLRTNLNYNKNKNYTSKIKQNSYGGNIDIFMRLKPNLNVNFKVNFVRSKSIYADGTTTSSSSQIYGFLIDWRISRCLSFTTTQYLNKSSKETGYMFFYNLSFAPFKKIRINSSYSGVRDNSKMDNITLSLMWYIAPRISFNTSYNWNNINGERKWSWNWGANLTF